MSVPIWFGSYSASDRAAEAAREEAAFDTLAIHDTMNRDIRTALSAWQSAHEQLALLRGPMHDQASQAYAAESANYLAGTSGFAEVIQSAQQILMLDLGIARLTRDAGVAEATILQAAGLRSSFLRPAGDLE